MSRCASGVPPPHRGANVRWWRRRPGNEEIHFAWGACGHDLVTIPLRAEVVHFITGANGRVKSENSLLILTLDRGPPGAKMPDLCLVYSDPCRSADYTGRSSRMGSWWSSRGTP